MTTLFLGMAVGGAVLLLLGVVAGDLLDGLLDAVDVGDSGLLSLPVLGTFVSAAGVGGLVGDAAGDGSLPLSLAGAGVGGVGLGYVAFRLSKAFMDMPTDATLSSGDYQGRIARVVTPIAGGRGEVLLRVGGSTQKLMATSEVDIDRGSDAVIIEVLSSSAVRVVPMTEILEDPSP